MGNDSEGADGVMGGVEQWVTAGGEGERTVRPMEWEVMTGNAVEQWRWVNFLSLTLSLFHSHLPPTFLSITIWHL